MFDRFGDDARKLFGFARQEAQRLHHDHIGSEHILLGLCRLRTCSAATILLNLGVEPGDLAAAIESEISPGPALAPLSQLPFTPRAKRVLEHALEEYTDLGDSTIGTGHILLGLARADGSLASQVLAAAGLRVEDLREEVRATASEPALAPPTPRPKSKPRRRFSPFWLGFIVGYAAALVAILVYLAARHLFA